MPIDAVFLESLCEELQGKLLTCRVDKVQQPERADLADVLRAHGKRKVVLQAKTSRKWFVFSDYTTQNKRW